MADEKPQPIAIVGMSCRLPGDVASPGDFWKMMCHARSGWCEVPADRFNAEAYHHPNPDKKGCLNSQGGYFLKQDLSLFDAAFFDITRKEAESMDPAQRLILECAYEALENAGMPKEAITGRKVGVFVGANYNEHRMGNLRDLDHVPAFDATGNQGAFLAGRIAYYFNLRGPTLVVDTACSSSMHALHLAVQSLRAGESEAAVVAASHLITQPDIWVSMAKLRLFSDGGRTYAFDHRAKSGYARGEGAGCLVLKPLDRALADNDHIRAVIAHTGVSHNGRTVGIVAPSPDEQERLLRDVLTQARVDPRDVGFFEAHGTGTRKGDPIEATAIYKAVASRLPPGAEPLYVGSAKANVGHLEGASGLVSIIKAALMLYYGFVLPNAEFEQANEAIPLEKWNMRVPRMQRPWPSAAGRRQYCCVNNFGFSGSNATAILAPAPQARTLELSVDATYTALRLFVLSAADEPALRASMARLGVFLEQHAELYQTTMPRNLAYTLGQRRSHLPWRVALVTGMCSGLATALNSAEAVPVRSTGTPPRLAFIFTGQGAQWWGMGRELLRTHPVFAASVARADAALRAAGADFDLVEELTRDSATTRVGEAHISQPICSAVQLALTDLLASFGVHPSSVTGHSSGEIGAAYAAGALSFEGAMQAAYFRGRAIVELKRRHADLRGAMMAVGGGAHELNIILASLADRDNKAVVACENSPSSTTLSGDEAAIDRIAAVFRDKGTFNRKLFVDVAYHSHHMQLIADYYLSRVAHIVPLTTAAAAAPPAAAPAASSVSFFSSLRGRRVDLSELGPQYWVDNLTQAVRFATSLKALCEEAKPDILVEVGPHAALKGPIMQTLKTLGPAGNKIVYLPTLVRDQDATETCLLLAGQLFVRGHALDFYNINHNRQEKEKPDLIPTLFAYPWTRQRYWYESRLSRQHRLKPFARHDLLGTLADWYSEAEPTWRNVLRAEDLPWMREYRVQCDRMVFPVSGFVSMAVEAAAQRAAMRTGEATGAGGCEIMDLRVLEHLFLEDGLEFEVQLSLRTTETGGVDELRICSHEAGRGWIDHCHALVRTEGPCKPSSRQNLSSSSLRDPAHTNARGGKRPLTLGSSPDEPMSASSGADSSSDSGSMSNSKVQSSASSDAGHDACPDTPATEFLGGGGGGGGQTLDSSKLETAMAQDLPLAVSAASFYTGLSAVGTTYPRAFQALTELAASERDATGVVHLRDTRADMPLGHETPYRIHPTILDAMVQLPLAILGVGSPGCQNATHLPHVIRQIHISSLWSKATASQKSFHLQASAEPSEPGAFTVEAFAAHGSGPALVSILGLQYSQMHKPAPPPAEARELCFRVDWEPSRQDTKPKAEQGDEAAVKGAKHAITILAETANPSQDPLISSLCVTLETQTGLCPSVSSLRDITDCANTRFIVLSELDQPMLSSIAAPAFEQVKRLLIQSPGLLWVTRGASKAPTTPDANMALGLIRTARSERSAVAAAALDLDPQSTLEAPAQAALIGDVFARTILSSDGSSADADMEFAEEDGALVVPRIVPDGRLNVDVQRELGASAPYLQDFRQPGRHLELHVPGGDSFDDIYFTDSVQAPLAADEVEILVEASAITPDDAASTEDAGANAGCLVARACSGVVTRLGSKVHHHLWAGDRVCTLTTGPFRTHVRAKTTSVCRLPEDMKLDVAASLPLAFGAALHALAGVADVSPGERVLIAASAGPIAFAAIEVAQYLRADVFVLVQTDTERTAMRRFGVCAHHVLDGRSIYLRRQVDEVTSGECMDVILTATTNSGRGSGDVVSKAWECLAPFGHFVEVRTSGSHRSSRPKIGDNATFTSVNMTGLAMARPKALEQTLLALMDKFEAGAMCQSAEPVVFPVSEMARALQTVRDGAISPVVVVVPEAGEQVIMATHKRAVSLFRADGTHIIVGGTGGLGRSMAKWMVENGARVVVLLSRSGGGKDKFEELTEEINGTAARILVRKCDVIDSAQLRQTLDDLKESLPPVCGVIHSAMVLRDGLLETMSHRDYSDVIRPKVQGTWNIHNALSSGAGTPRLDYFIMLSSAAGILGSRGQAAYAAANTFLDAFAQFRTRQGLGCSVALDLTAVTGAGYIAENAEREGDILKNFGNETVSEREVLALLSCAVRGVCSGGQALTGMKLHLGSGGEFPYYARDARFSRLRAAARARAAEQGHLALASEAQSVGDAFRAAASPEEAVAVAERGILQKLSEVLTIDVANLDAGRNITAYGLDSLTAIELRNWIAQELRANLQILALLSAGTVHDLAIMIVEKARA